MGSNHSHVNVPLVVRGRVTRLRQCPQTAALVCRERPRSAEAGNRTDVSSAYLTRLGQFVVRERTACVSVKKKTKKKRLYSFYLFIVITRPHKASYAYLSGLISCVHFSDS